MRRVRLGVIGCGVIGQHHLRAARDWPSIELAAVADVRAEAAQQATSAFNVPRTYDSGSELLRDRDIDAVVLALPTGLRGPLALEALGHGKHVLLEKPSAMDAGELRRMQAARDGRVVACCSSRHRFLPSARAASEIVAGGALGPIRVLRARGVNAAGRPPANPPPAWRLSRNLNGGGILANWGVYDLDYLFGLTGWRYRPRLVLAQSFAVPPQFEPHVAPGSDAEAHAAAIVRLRDTAAAAAGREPEPVLTLERGEFLATQTEAAWQIIGTRGSLRLMMLPRQGNVLYHDETSTQEGVTTRVAWQGDEDWSIIHQGPVRDFADAIAHGRPPMTGLDEALIVQQTLDAIYESSRTGEAVAIEA